MSEKNDGGRAFPVAGSWSGEDGPAQYDGLPQPGMSLRAYYAGQALVGYLAGSRPEDGDYPRDEKLARWCVATADALIAELERKS